MRYIGHLQASAADKLDCFRSLYGFLGFLVILFFYRAFTANPIVTNVSKKKKNVQGCPVKINN
jgi:hypothetical protein